MFAKSLMQKTTLTMIMAKQSTSLTKILLYTQATHLFVELMLISQVKKLHHTDKYLFKWFIRWVLATFYKI